MMNIVLIVAAAVFLILYLMKRRARLRKEQ